MKTRELINILKEIDPTGECEVCIGSSSIMSVDRHPSYWDSPLQTVSKRDKDFFPLKSTITIDGDKVNISVIELEMLFIDWLIDKNKEYPIDIKGYEKLENDWITKKMKWVSTAREIMLAKGIYTSEKELLVQTLLMKYSQDSMERFEKTLLKIPPYPLEKINSIISKIIERYHVVFEPMQKIDDHYYLRINGNNKYIWIINKLGEVKMYIKDGDDYVNIKEFSIRSFKWDTLFEEKTIY